MAVLRVTRGLQRRVRKCFTHSDSTKGSCHEACAQCQAGTVPQKRAGEPQLQLLRITSMTVLGEIKGLPHWFGICQWPKLNARKSKVYKLSYIMISCCYQWVKLKRSAPVFSYISD